MAETYHRAMVDLGQTDVLVIGGGCAGVTAALAAAHEGASVVLVERYGFLGGISTQVIDTFYGFYTLGDRPQKVVGGIPDLVVEELMKRGQALVRPNTYGAGDGITYNQEALKVVWESLARQAGVRLLYHTFAMDALMGDGVVAGAVTVNKGGLARLRAAVTVDASGDADLAAAAGVPFEGPGEGGAVQSLTTTFRLCGVDVERARQVSKDELHRRMREAVKSGDYDLPRQEGSVHITPLAATMATNMTRVGNVNALDPEQLAQAETEGRRQALEYLRFLRDRVPGYERADLANLSTQIGVRESRRIIGEYRLQRRDVLEARKFADAIARCGAPIEDHHAGSDTRWEHVPEGETYDIPYRCLVPRKVDGLLVAGRCLSADHDAHASVRSMAQCMAMGQAAGVAAALAVRQRCRAREVSIPELQTRLRAIGAAI